MGVLELQDQDELPAVILKGVLTQKERWPIVQMAVRTGHNKPPLDVGLEIVCGNLRTCGSNSSQTRTNVGS
jgi:hypothetical protein